MVASCTKPEIASYLAMTPDLRHRLKAPTFGAYPKHSFHSRGMLRRHDAAIPSLQSKPKTQDCFVPRNDNQPSSLRGGTTRQSLHFDLNIKPKIASCLAMTPAPPPLRGGTTRQSLHFDLNIKPKIASCLAMTISPRHCEEARRGNPITSI